MWCPAEREGSHLNRDLVLAQRFFRGRSRDDEDPGQAESRAVGDPGEVALVTRAQAGDLGSFDELLALHHAAAERVALLILRSADDAADAVQEGFIRAYRAIGRFRTGEPFRPWLISIVANEARGLRRRAGRRARLAERLTATPPRHEPSAEVVGLARASGVAVLEALARMPERDRIVIAYRYFADLSEGEMSLILRVPRGTVKSRLSRALVRLRAELDP